MHYVPFKYELPNNEYESDQSRKADRFFGIFPFFEVYAIDYFLHDKANSDAKKKAITGNICYVNNERIVDFTAKLVNDKDPLLREAVRVQIGWCGNEKVFYALEKAWGNGVLASQKISIGVALLTLNNKKAIPLFKKELEKKPTRLIKHFCIGALYMLTDEKKYKSEIISYVKYSSQKEKEILLKTLAQVLNSKMIALSEIALKDKDPKIRAIARKTIKAQIDLKAYRKD